MLGSRRKKEETAAKNAVAFDSSNCVVSKGAVIEGKFSSKDSLRLDGQVNGEVDCKSRLVMGESGKVIGSVKALEAEILGTVEGDLTIAGALNLRSSAKIKGNISAKTMSVDEGAVYNGECRIGEYAAPKKVTKVIRSEA